MKKLILLCLPLLLNCVAVTDDGSFDDGFAADNEKVLRGSPGKVDGSVPADWNCNIAYFDARDGCDCGCGAIDPDCNSEARSACDYEWCDDGGEPLANSNTRCDNDVSTPEPEPEPEPEPGLPGLGELCAGWTAHCPGSLLCRVSHDGAERCVSTDGGSCSNDSDCTRNTRCGSDFGGPMRCGWRRYTLGQTCQESRDCVPGLSCEYPNGAGGEICQLP